IEQALEATGTDEVWEFGAGSGALAVQLLSALGGRVKRYTIVDLSGILRERQHQRLVAELPEQAHKVVWADRLPDTLQGVIVGNEVLDAMPLRLLHWDGQAWLERGVALGTSEPLSFAWADRPTTDQARPPTDHPDAAFAPGTVVECHPQAEA